MQQRLYHPKQIAFMGDVKARQPVERHCSTLGHRQRPILHHTYPANKKNITRIMITGGPPNYVHKSQSLRKNSPYTVRRVGSFMAHPVNDMLNQQLVLVNNYYGSKRFKTNDDTSERARRVAEVEKHTQSPVSFAHRFNSSTSVHINSPQEDSPHRSNVRGFDDVLTITRLRNEQIEAIENNEVHTISLESKHNSLPNPRAGGRGGANKSIPNHFVKVNNYVGSLDRRSQFSSKTTPQSCLVTKYEANRSILAMLPSMHTYLHYKLGLAPLTVGDAIVSGNGQKETQRIGRATSVALVNW